MDYSFMDVCDIVDFLLSTGKAYRGNCRDKVNVIMYNGTERKNALSGRAEKALIIEDVQIYMPGPLLEYARLCNDEGGLSGHMDANKH
jgi:hypothetical protein